MIETLFGSKSVERVLLFLFVNGKAYGTRLKSVFQTSLTPFQKALDKLEKGGVLISDYEGKTKVYQFNPSFPLYQELEALLKKSYSLLPSSEKKTYYVKDHMENPRVRRSTKRATLEKFWEKLKQVETMGFHAKSKAQDGWNGKGRGSVVVEKQGENVLLFHEKGAWSNALSEEVSFSNVFRWTYEKELSLISLEHLRHGILRPVFLFHLAPENDHLLSSIDSHLCEGDTYFGKVQFDRHVLRLKWRVIGSKKNEEIDTFYS